MGAALVIMAAGMGSRYGGDKQVDGIGPSGEILLEYSIHDAIRAGFRKIVFIIKPNMEATVRAICGDRLAHTKAPDGTPIQVEYAFQDFSSVPAFYTIPAARTKPFGTAHAVLCARSAVQEPFAVLNADDYYGVSAFQTMYDALQRLQPSGEAAMVGYRLKNTVSPNGTVTRGVCSMADGKLTKVTETYQIQLFPDGSIRDMHTDPAGVPLDPESLVSMNFWGFTPWIFGELERYFTAFLRQLGPEDVKSECLLPSLVDELIHSGDLTVEALSTDAVWFGMTYRADRETVAQALRELHAKGVYPPSLRDSTAG